MDVVVWCCSFLLQTFLTLKTSPLEAGGADPNAVVAMKDASSRISRVLSGLISAPQVAELLWGALSVSTDKDLMLRTLECLALAQMRGGPDWLSLADTLFHLGQKRVAAWEEVTRRLVEIQAGADAMMTALQQRTIALEAEEASREEFRLR